MTRSRWLMLKRNNETVTRPNRPYKMRAQRWSCLKHNKHKRLLKSIDVGKYLNFCSYTFTLLGVAEIELYTNLGGTNVQILNDVVPMNIHTRLTIISPTILPLLLSRRQEASIITPNKWWGNWGYDQLAIQITGEIAALTLLRLNPNLLVKVKSNNCNIPYNLVAWCSEGWGEISRVFHLLEKIV